jgi:hypothetical protein
MFAVAGRLRLRALAFSTRGDMDGFRGPRLAAALGLMVATSSAAAQQSQVEAHGSYARTTQSHSNSWGAGAQLNTNWGSKQAPVQLSTSEGIDWTKQENDGPSTTSLGLDVTIQPGGGGVFTPYAGGSASANWVSKNAPGGALLGLEYLAGVFYKLEAQGKLSLHAEVRAGYVRTQEHTVTGRFGVAFSI